MTRPTPRQLELLGLIAKLTASLSRPPHPREVARTFGAPHAAAARELRARGWLEPADLPGSRATLRLTDAGWRRVADIKPRCRACGVISRALLCSGCADRFVGCSL